MPNNKINMSDIKQQHVTNDLAEAAYLKVLGFPMRIDGSHPKRVAFVFDGDEEMLKRKALDFYEYRARVDARMYSDSLKGLKRIVVEHLNKQYEAEGNHTQGSPRKRG
jgi:hypothetical protein